MSSMETPILDELLDFKSKKYTKFFMPGHNQLVLKDDYSDTQREVFDIFKKFEQDIFSLDVTEVGNFDNLSSPSGIIKKSSDILSQSFSCKESFLLVNGSTVGVLSMICAITEECDKIIIQKNSHKSVYNACKLKKLDVKYLESKKNEEFDIYESIDEEYFEEILSQNKDAKAVVITSSDYYGQNQDIRKLSQICKKYDMLLLVDAAHCSNYNYSDLFDDFPVKYADVVVTSYHKTMPAINQTALLLVNKNLDDDIADKVRENINIFQTTSPSYIMLSNIELANAVMEKYGEKLYSGLYENISEFKRKIENINKTALNKIKILKNDDFSRLVISIENYEIGKAYEFLKENMILPEMINEKSFVFIANIFHTKEDFDRLFCSLEKLSQVDNKKPLVKKENIDENTKKLDAGTNNRVNEEKYRKNLYILNYIKSSINKKSDKNVFIYPPGTPVLAIGDTIKKEHIKRVEKAIENKISDVIY